MGWEKEPEDGVVEGLLGFEVVVDVVVVVVGRAEVLRWWSSMGSDGSTSSSLFSCKLRIKIAFRNSLDRVRLFFRAGVQNRDLSLWKLEISAWNGFSGIGKRRCF